jgi:hypothetical protein
MTVAGVIWHKPVKRMRPWISSSDVGAAGRISTGGVRICAGAAEEMVTKRRSPVNRRPMNIALISMRFSLVGHAVAAAHFTRFSAYRLHPSELLAPHSSAESFFRISAAIADDDVRMIDTATDEIRGNGRVVVIDVTTGKALARSEIIRPSDTFSPQAGRRAIRGPKI